MVALADLARSGTRALAGRAEPDGTKGRWTLRAERADIARGCVGPRCRFPCGGRGWTPADPLLLADDAELAEDADRAENGRRC